ncbi:hypothetical protein Q7454_05160 [Glaesserella parasuis]|nr:hypothetical protein [Glaesserella parasuis]
MDGWGGQKCNIISLNEKARIRNYLAFGVAVMSCGFNQYRPIDRSKKDITIAGLDAEQIAKYLVRARAFAKEVEVFHRKLHEDLGISRYVKNDIAGKAYNIAHEFNVWLDPFIEQALPQLNQQRLTNF